MNKKLKNLLTSKLFTTISCITFVIFLVSTDPNRLPLGMILFIIVLFYLCLSLVILQIMQLIRITKKDEISKKTVFNSFIIALLPTSLLLLISINQLTFKDFLLLILFSILVLLYISKFKVKKY